MHHCPPMAYHSSWLPALEDCPKGSSVNALVLRGQYSRKTRRGEEGLLCSLFFRILWRERQLWRHGSPKATSFDRWPRLEAALRRWWRYGGGAADHHMRYISSFRHSKFFHIAMAVVVVEIVSLLWSHPILTGLLILLFTTPLFHIVLFFTPLLMSTALCVIALISIGPQIEKIREERQFKMSIAARAVVAAPPDRPVNRYIVVSRGRPRRPAMRLAGGGGGDGGGGRRWSDWVKGIEIHGHTIWLSESHIMRDIAEEGLKSDFSHEDGGLAMAAEDLSKGAFSLEKDGAADCVELGEADKGIEEEVCCQQEMKLVEVKVDGLSSETGIVVLDEAQQGDKEKGSQLELAACSEVPVDEKMAEASSGSRFYGLVPVQARSSFSATANTSYQPFVLSKSLSSPLALKDKKKKKRTSWLRRRRIPCGISKALGQLREKICNQLRRIFS